MKAINRISTGATVAMISNCLSHTNLREVEHYKGYLAEGVFNPFTFSFKHLKGLVIPLEILPEQSLNKDGIRLARSYFLNAVDYCAETGIKTILLAASTKRLFGEGDELRKRYPEICFTIGDNGTAYAFLKQIEWLSREISRSETVMVAGAGFLGHAAIGCLQRLGFKRIVVVSRHSLKDSSLEVYKTPEEYCASEYFKPPALLLCCAHNHNIQAQTLEKLCSEKMTIIDVAVPKAVPASVFQAVKKQLIRYDGGDFEIPGLQLHFPHQMIGLCYPTEFYGCFTEALLLSLSEKNYSNNFFVVNEENLQLIATLLHNYTNDIFVPMRSFGEEVEGMLICYGKGSSVPSDSKTA